MKSHPQVVEIIISSRRISKICLHRIVIDEARVTVEGMEKRRRLKPPRVGTINYLEWTGANYLRHAMVAGLTKNSALTACGNQ